MTTIPCETESMAVLANDPQPLNALDRCDRCGAQAYIRFTRAGDGKGEILFCGHHNREHGKAAAEWATHCRDETSVLAPEDPAASR